MKLEQIKNKAYREARRKAPSPNFGTSIHEYGETHEQVMHSIEEKFRDEMACSALHLLHSTHPRYAYESLNSYYFELIKAFEDVGASVYEINHTPWNVKVEFPKAEYCLRVSGSVKLDCSFIESITMHAAPSEVAQLLAMIQDIQIPHDHIFKESLKLYSCEKIMRTSALALIEDVLEEHSCGCSIHISGKDKMKILVYGRKPENMEIFFTLHTDLEKLREELIAKLEHGHTQKKKP